MKTNKKIQKRLKRKATIRKTVVGTKERPRVSVFRSNKHLYAQVIDDDSRTTILSSKDSEIKSTPKTTKVDIATEVGKDLGKKLKKEKIQSVVFDRNGYKYHGRVKAVAEGLREEGIIV